MYRLRFFDDYGSGWLWPGDDATRDAFDLGPIDALLPISPETRALADQLSAQHAASLNQDYPPDGCQWPQADRDAFNAQVESLYQRLWSELGSDFLLTDERMIL